MPQSDNRSPGASNHRAGEFVRLFVRHERHLYAYLLTVLGNPADAEDVLQQTSIVLWEKFEEFSADGDFMAWGIKTAYYTAKNFLRKNSRSRVTFSQPMFEAVAGRAASSGAEVNAVHEALETCLDGLPDADRELIQQRYEMEASVSSISESIGRSIHAVYRALSRIHVTLFDCVSSQLVAEDV